MEIDEDGHLHYSANYSGISFDKKISNYTEWDASGNTTVHDYIGFLDISE